MPSFPHRFPGLALLLLPLLLLLAAVAARAQPLPEVELKAQILWRALQFVDWPAEAGPAQVLQLCLLSPGPLAEALREWQQRELNGRRVELRRVVVTTSTGAVGSAGGTVASTSAGPKPAAALPAAAVAGCHVAYVGTDALLPVPAPRGLLWVGDSHGLTERGVTLNLQPHQGRIVFDVDLQAARRAGLEINARLLRLARFVHMEGSP
ncbi:YfiR family protein [Azohydromonas australica]|uniref:YfiR family protein n=1 Tax=Azohydromonas australica TaxID=364039 RepID=UPI000490BC36|nr:YfiR family protein [Azohydromonas australica]